MSPSLKSRPQNVKKCNTACPNHPPKTGETSPLPEPISTSSSTSSACLCPDEQCAKWGAGGVPPEGVFNKVRQQQSPRIMGTFRFVTRCVRKYMPHPICYGGIVRNYFKSLSKPNYTALLCLDNTLRETPILQATHMQDHHLSVRQTQDRCRQIA